MSPQVACVGNRQAPAQLQRCPYLWTNCGGLERQPFQMLRSLKCLVLDEMTLGPKTEPVFMKTDGVKGEKVGGKRFQA